MKRDRSFISLVALIALWLSSASAQVTEIKITPDDIAEGDFFGVSVSISGDFAVIGSFRDDDRGVNSGSAYIFMREGASWIEQAKLTANDGTSNDAFGRSVGINGDYVIIGAPGDLSGELGSAYIFKRQGTSWVNQVKLRPGDVADGDGFGGTLSIDGDYAIVGSPGDDDMGVNAGAAYFFKRDGVTWTEEVKVTNIQAAADDQFGASVSLDGDYAVVGQAGPFTVIGAAYVFKHDGGNWTRQTKLTASDSVVNDAFGRSVFIEGDYIIAGAPWHSSGFAYVFKRDGENWTEQFKFTNSGSNNSFGSVVALSKEYALIAATGVSVFKREGASWTEQVSLTASDGPGGLFGFSFSISGDYIIIGSPQDDHEGSRAGSAYIFTGFSTPTSIGQDISKTPISFTLEQNYPNPFNPTTVISYQTSALSDVELTIYNQLGQEVKTLVNERKPAGVYQIQWDGRDHSGKQVVSGVYLYRVRTGSYVQTRKMLLLQ